MEQHGGNTKHRAWVLTVNNPTEDDKAAIESADKYATHVEHWNSSLLPVAGIPIKLRQGKWVRDTTKQ